MASSERAVEHLAIRDLPFRMANIPANTQQCESVGIFGERILIIYIFINALSEGLPIRTNHVLTNTSRRPNFAGKGGSAME